MKTNRQLACCALVLLAACGGAAGHATFAVDGQAESIVNLSGHRTPCSRGTCPQATIQIEGDRANADPPHHVVFSLDIPVAAGPFDCTTAAVTYYEPAGSTPGAPSFAAPTWVADKYNTGTSCSGDWEQQGSQMVGCVCATLKQLLVDSTQTRQASGCFDVAAPN